MDRVDKKERLRAMAIRARDARAIEGDSDTPIRERMFILEPLNQLMPVSDWADIRYFGLLEYGWIHEVWDWDNNCLNWMEDPHDFMHTNLRAMFYDVNVQFLINQMVSDAESPDDIQGRAVTKKKDVAMESARANWKEFVDAREEMFGPIVKSAPIGTGLAICKACGSKCGH
jgi:hypothetical protein